MMAASLYQGDKQHLEKIFSSINKEQLNAVLDSVKVCVNHFS